MNVTIFGSGYMPSISEDEKSLITNITEYLVRKGYNIKNGGYYGVMEISAKAASEAGGKTFGYIVDSMSPNANKHITTVFKNPDLFVRLKNLMSNSKAYLFFNGGIGTYTELLLALDYSRKLSVADRPKIIIVGSRLREFIESLSDIAAKGELSGCIFINSVDNLKKYI